MRIVFVNRIGWPDEGATALYLTNVAESLAAAGHETHVVCGEAPYRAAPGQGRRPRAPVEHAGVRYHRVPGSRGRGTLDRALKSAAFLARVALRLLRLRRPDVVVALTDPPFVDVVAGAVGRLQGARTVHWLMDTYPDVAVAAGVLRAGSLADRLLGGLMGAGLRRASAVVVLGKSMRRPILARGVSRRRLRVIENWAPAVVEEVASRPVPPRPERPFTLMYSGTYGVAHDLSPLLDALRRLPRDAPVRLVLQVSGSRVAELRRSIGDLPIPVEWRGPVPRERYVDSLREGDAHVVCVRGGFERLVVPSKLYAPLALGLPVLLVGPGSHRFARPAAGTASPAMLPAALVASPGMALVTRSRGHGSRAGALAAWRSVLETSTIRTSRDTE